MSSGDSNEVSQSFVSGVASNYAAIASATLLQHVLAVVWFSFIVRTLHNYYLAADKGVKKVEYIKYRYPVTLCAAITFGCALLRSITFVFLAGAFHVTTLCGYHSVGIVLGCISVINQHQFFTSQRPVPLFLCEIGYELAASLLAATTIFYLQ